MSEQAPARAGDRGAGATTRPLHHDDLWAIPVPSDPHLSPDGRRVAYVVTVPDREDDDYRSTIWLAEAVAGSIRQLTNGPHDAAPRWSPDGETLAFLRRKERDKAPQLYLLRVDGGEPVPLTDRQAGAGEPVWSPDGTRLAFTGPVDLDGGTDHDPVVISRLDYKADGAGLLKGKRSHLFALDVPPSGSAPVRPRQLTFGDSSASSPVWSPDGARLAYTTSRRPDRDLELESVVHAIPVSGGLPSALSPAGGSYQVVDWSPDGASLLLVGQPGLTAGNAHLYALPAGGGEPVALVPGLDRNVVPGAPGYPGALPRYRDDGNEVLFCIQDGGRVHVLAVPSDGGDPVEILGGDRVIAGLSAAAGVVAFVAATATSPGEVWVLDGTERVLTDLFATALPDVEPVRPEPQTFTAPDGTTIHGWLLRGRAGAAGPLLLDIHGGPHNNWSPVLDTAHLYHQTLAGEGWGVLVINPRASDGYGEAFRTAAVGGWGTADEGDFHAALDDLVERGIADPARLAVSGYSYGGYMTCWLTARSDRFAAAVPGGCVCDLISVAGTSDVGRFLAGMELEGSVVAARNTLLASSPLTYVAGVRTPTLLLHGEEDRRCPIGQAEEWFAALRDQRVPVELVRYPGQSHLFILNGRPSHRADYARRLTSWVIEHTARAGNEPVAGRSKGRTTARPADLGQRLEALIGRHGVPGASVAVLAGGEVVTAAAGVLNAAAGVAATPGSLFQIGSITKVYTATVAMQLVDEGLVELDAPLADVLPDFELADDEVAKTVTLRHLLTHTSGIQGDHFPDFGRGDDSIARFVASCAELGQSHPLGATMSYCNTGFVVVGRVIEQLTGQTWDQALAGRLFAPLGLGHTVTLPEEVLRFRGAIGHVGKPGEPPQPAPMWGLPRSCGPAGLICASASDVIAFARMHLEGGRSPGGGKVLAADTVAAMQEPQVAVPDPYTLGSHWGLGWILFNWGGRRLYGHDGNTIGQSAFLRVVPDRDVAIALLTNGGNAKDLFQDLCRPLLEELAGAEMPFGPEPPAQPVDGKLDLDEHVGVYERLGMRMEIERRGGKLAMRAIVTGPLAEVVPDPVTELDLTAVKPGLFVTRERGTLAWNPLVFYRLADGSRYVHFGARATPQVS